MANTTGGTCLHCGRSIPTQQGKGRLRLYCDATCRSAARRTRSTGVKTGLTSAPRKGTVDIVSAEPLPAVAAARARMERSEQDLRSAVDRAREQGHTWQEIGEVLGTTRQAAFQRFGRPIDPRTGAPMAGTVLPGATDRAVELLGDIIQGDYDKARTDFDETVAKGLSAVQLASVWAQLAGMVGAYQSMGTPHAYRAGDYTIVDTPLTFEAGDLTGRVTYSMDGKVAGLHLVPVK
jgi:hypothetical protein